MNSDQVKTVLIFAYYWPPASGPGVQRWLKFVKYLPENGWKAIVVTPENGSYPNTDFSLINDIPSSAKIERTKTLEPFRLFNLLTGQNKRGNASSVGMGDIKGSTSLIKKVSAYIRANYFVPDARKGWVRYALKAANQIIKKQKIDLVVTTGPPHSSHLIGLSLKKTYSLPWVADFRDPWTNIYYNKFLPRSQKTKKKDLALENLVLKNANAITVVSKGQKTEFEGRTPVIEVIPNGYDFEDFESLSKKSDENFFRLSYIGNLKVNQNCIILWEALKEISRENALFTKHFKLSFTGNVHEEIIEVLEDLGLSNMLENLPFVEHKEAVQRMLNAQSLLFLIPESANNTQIITGKIFEYLASQTPLLSIGPVNGDAAEILRTCHRYEMIDYSNKDAIKLRLLTLFNDWLKDKKASVISSDEHIVFSRKNLTNKLTKLFEQLSS